MKGYLTLLIKDINFLKLRFKSIILGAFLLLFSFNLHAKIELPAIIGSNMVLQRNALAKIWGTAAANKKISIKTSWNGKTYNVATDVNGTWKAEVQTLEAGGPYTITIGGDGEVVLENVLIGEVWISSGQSNMEMPVSGYMGQPIEGAIDDITEAVKYPDIRMFTVARNSTPEKQKDCKGEWKVSTAENVGKFSAVAYFYAKQLNKVLSVPVGIITSNWGASVIEAWMPVSTIKQIEGINQNLALSGDKDNTKAGHLYNGMIAPVTNFTAQGFIWYQGESNIRNYGDYAKLMEAMVSQWRADWKNDNMFFLYVQLAPFKYNGADKIGLPLTIEAQYNALKLIPKAGIAATNDLGEIDCIHPAKKRQVGQRLAFLAFDKIYKLKGYPVAPTFKEAVYDKDKIKLTFNYGGSSMNSFDYSSGSMLGFEIAGADRKFYKANATHVQWKNEIELNCPEVKEPVAVRYGFRNFNENTVRTVNGMPLVPFRTDNWNDVF